MRDRSGIDIPGARVRVLVSSRDTGGRYAICQIETAGLADAPGHSHSYEDVCFFVAEGEFWFTVGGDPVDACRGASIFVPRHTAYQVRGQGSLLMLGFPGGVDLLLQDLVVATARSMTEILEKHGIAKTADGNQFH
jgi:quercetin dioxygenase-like cupin family protein